MRDLCICLEVRELEKAELELMEGASQGRYSFGKTELTRRAGQCECGGQNE